jgi:hypothetical protein
LRYVVFCELLCSSRAWDFVAIWNGFVAAVCLREFGDALFGLTADLEVCGLGQTAVSLLWVQVE